MAYDVLVVYAALAIWVVVAIDGWRRERWWPTALIGMAIAVALNVRYFIEGPPAAIAFFVGIYDVFDNLGLSSEEGAPALAACVDNACTVWGDRFQRHASWGVAFHDRFLNGPASRTNLLYLHIGFNTIAFLLMHYQVFRTGLAKGGSDGGAARHRLLGRVTFGSLTLGTIGAVMLASEHDQVDAYGGLLAELGFYSMSAFVFGTAVMSAVTARRRQIASHRIWSIRALGAMWGSFWLFRVMLVVTGPLLRQWDTLSIQLSIWLSAPLGILIAEALRRRSIRRAPQSGRINVAPPTTVNA